MSDLHLVDDENLMVINTASGLILLQLCGKNVAPVADSARINAPVQFSNRGRRASRTHVTVTAYIFTNFNQCVIPVK